MRSGAQVLSQEWVIRFSNDVTGDDDRLKSVYIILTAAGDGKPGDEALPQLECLQL